MGAERRGGMLQGIARRAMMYVRQDVREIVFPSSIPDETNEGKKHVKVYSTVEVCITDHEMMMMRRRRRRRTSLSPVDIICV